MRDSYLLGLAQGAALVNMAWIAWLGLRTSRDIRDAHAILRELEDGR